MPEMSAYGDGVPSWIDLASPDMAASKAFYTALFGWEAFTPPVPEAGGYTLFSIGGKQVAGAGPIMSQEQPPAWTTYVNVTDADGTAKKIADAGGNLLMGPMDVMDQGRMALFADPSGAVLGLWQPGTHTGAQLVNEPGTYCWSELATRDVEGSKAFYGAVFGWEASTEAAGPMEYTEFKVGGNSIAGMYAIGPDSPEDMPPHWGVYFAVADCDAAVGTASTLGATVFEAPTDIPVGRFAVLRDPQGAFFRMVKLSAPM
ncbi:MAG: VOC family protein [Micromonosporaceae bacterium]